MHFKAEEKGWTGHQAYLSPQNSAASPLLADWPISMASQQIPYVVLDPLAF